MLIISAVGLFCIDKFEDNQMRNGSTFFRMSKLTKPYFAGLELISIRLYQCACFVYVPQKAPRMVLCFKIWSQSRGQTDAAASEDRGCFCEDIITASLVRTS